MRPACHAEKQGRDRRFQAILPLRGKILNVEKARFDRMISSQEIATLISALGAGIAEDFDLEKLRYHRIVIMTDADVDGSHIRTLLLTFFFRQMPAIVEQGYLYIAQPPLYKVKKGRSERYIKDEDAFEDYLLAGAIAATSIETATGDVLEGDAVRDLIAKIQEYRHKRQVFCVHADPRVIDALVQDIRIEAADFDAPENLERKLQALAELLDERHRDTLFSAPRVALPAAAAPQVDDADESGAEAPDAEATHAGESDATADPDAAEATAAEPAPTLPPAPVETGPYAIWQTRLHSTVRTTRIDEALLQRPGFVQLLGLYDAIHTALGDTYALRGKDGTPGEPLPDFETLAETVFASAKKGQTIQRYKGLGEMNAEQLWETTMDPERRTLLNVTVRNADDADSLFTVLMGDQVEPRREYIQDNALRIGRELDV